MSSPHLSLPDIHVPCCRLLPAPHKKRDSRSETPPLCWHHLSADNFANNSTTSVNPESYLTLKTSSRHYINCICLWEPVAHFYMTRPFYKYSKKKSIIIQYQFLINQLDRIAWNTMSLTRLTVNSSFCFLWAEFPPPQLESAVSLQKVWKDHPYSQE